MIRYVLRPGGWEFDPGPRREGRGVYLCSAQCAERVAKNKRYPGLAEATSKGPYGNR